jgi:hypothetical protein
LGPAVIVRGCHGCADGSGTQADAHAHAHATAHVSSAVDASAVDPSRANSAPAVYAAIGEGVGRNARDAKGGDQGKRDDSLK